VVTLLVRRHRAHRGVTWFSGFHRPRQATSRCSKPVNRAFPVTSRVSAFGPTCSKARPRLPTWHFSVTRKPRRIGRPAGPRSYIWGRQRPARSTGKEKVTYTPPPLRDKRIGLRHRPAASLPAVGRQGKKAVSPSSPSKKGSRWTSTCVCRAERTVRWAPVRLGTADVIPGGSYEDPRNGRNGPTFQFHQ